MPGHNDLPCADPINLSAAPARPDNPHHPQGLAKTRSRLIDAAVTGLPMGKSTGLFSER
jgi:hypothetical protein